MSDTETNIDYQKEYKICLPRVIRHHYSGVWFGYILGEGSIPNTLHIVGRRVHTWRGGRLETSQLATQGLRQEDLLGDWIENEISLNGIVDVLKTTSELVENVRALPRTVVAEDYQP